MERLHMRLQSINNIYQPGPNRRRNVIITIIIFFILIASYVLIVISLDGKNEENKVTDSQFNTYYDNYSGQRVSGLKDQKPERYGVEGDPITFLGVSSLLKIGVTRFNIESYRTAIENFSSKRETKINEVSININSIESNTRNRTNKTDYPTYKFKIKINRQEDFDATLKAYSIATASLTLEQDGKVIFESEKIDSSNKSNAPGD